MSLKDKIVNLLSAHPKIVTFGIGLAITFAIGTAIGSGHYNNIWQLWLHSGNTAVIDNR